MRRSASFGAWLVAAAAVAYTGSMATSPPGAANVFRGYSTGTDVHVALIDAAGEGPRIVDAEVAFSGAAVDREGLTGPIINEMQQAITPPLTGTATTTTTQATTTTTSASPIPTLQPTTTTSSTIPQPAKMASGRGIGLELGLGTDLPNDNANQLQQATDSEEGPAFALAPPSTNLVTREIALGGANPIAYASLLRGQAQAIYEADPCNPATPRGFGLAYAADVQLLNSGEINEDESFQNPAVAVDAQEPDRSASQSVSRTFLEPKGDGTYAMVSEVRETIAPVTLGKDDLNPVNDTTIEVLGEWVLRVVATGNDGGATVHYGPNPETTTPETPVLRIRQGGAPLGEFENILTFQDVFGETGFTLPANPLVNIAIGEDPRKISAPGVTPDPESQPELAANGTKAAAGVDVVRVQILPNPLEPGTQITDVRIGHMEVSAQVPEGGVRLEQCATTTQAPPTTTSTTTTTRPAVTIPSIVTTTTRPAQVVSQPPQARPAVPIPAQPRFTG